MHVDVFVKLYAEHQMSIYTEKMSSRRKSGEREEEGADNNLTYTNRQVRCYFPTRMHPNPMVAVRALKEKY